MTVWILAIDLGTSGPKVALVSSEGEVRGGAFEPTRLTLLAGGGAVQDPDDWWRAITNAARRVTGAEPDLAADVAGVAVTAQWSGTVPVGPGGRHVADAIIWMDSRGAPDIRRMIRGPVRIEGYGVSKVLRWIRKTGGGPAKSGKDPIAHIKWLQRERPDICRSTALFLEPKDYLNLRLTGRAAATFDSIALHWVTDNRDPSRVRYDDGLLRVAGIERAKLPGLVPATAVLGPLLPEAAGQLGLPAGVPVIGGTPDVQSAALGSGGIADYDAHLYIGTSAWLSCHVPFKKTDMFRNVASLPAPLPGRYFVANEQETAGACLDALAALLDGAGAAADYQAFDTASASAPAGAGGVIFTPWLNGERTPVEDSRLRGSFAGLSLSINRDHLVRSVFEGVALNARWLLHAVERFVGRRLDPIRMLGGGARSEIWCRIHADVLDRTIRRVADPIWGNVRGVGLLAAAALGHIGYQDIETAVPIDAVYRPDPANRATYDAAFGTFRSLHKATRRIRPGIT